MEEIQNDTPLPPPSFLGGLIRYSPSQIDRIMHYRFECFAWGLAFIAYRIWNPLGLNVGLFLGFTLFGLGIYSGVLRNWRTEPGLWMMAALLVVLLGPLYAFFSYSWLVDGPGNGPNFQGPAFFLECSLALIVFSMQVKLAYSIFRENRVRTRAPAQRTAQKESDSYWTDPRIPR
jgi:hypothetical protein